MPNTFFENYRHASLSTIFSEVVMDKKIKAAFTCIRKAALIRYLPGLQACFLNASG